MTGVYSEDGTAPGRLAGGDVQWNVDPMTTVRGEGAWSEDGDGREGSAWLAELERRGGRLDGTAWYRRQAPGFGLAQQNQGEQGIEKYGGDLSWHATRADRATLLAFRELNLSSFYRWRKILDDLDRLAATRPRSEPDPLPLQSFVPVRVIPDAVVEVILPSGVQLRVPLSADVPQLARLVQALGASPC